MGSASLPPPWADLDAIDYIPVVYIHVPCVFYAILYSAITGVMAPSIPAGLAFNYSVNCCIHVTHKSAIGGLLAPTQAA